MKRDYRKQSLFDAKRLGTIAFALFVVYVAFKILTPPNKNLALVDSPDGAKTARLNRYFYYNNQPSYMIYYREKGRHLWKELYHLPAYTNVPPDAAHPSLAWSDDSERLDFLMNGTSIWHHVFRKTAAVETAH